MKIKNISVGDSVQIKKGKHLDYFKDDEICQVIDIDAGDKYGFDVLIDGQKGLDWVNHKYLKKPEPQLKQLDQSVFDGLDDDIICAVVKSNGEGMAANKAPFLTLGGEFWGTNMSARLIHLGGGYDASNWQNSLIERDTTKEPAEVDLSSELTGSELCKAMLERGDKFVVCKLADTSEADAISNSIAKLVTEYDGDGFYHELADSYWYFAVPINNQGEPLTASEVGL